MRVSNVLYGYRGSIAHGTYEPSTDPNSIDDIDLMGFVVPSIEHYYGLQQFGSRGTMEIKEGEYDIVLYELRKAFSLLLKGNINVLSMLWLPTQKYVMMDDIGKRLVKNRWMFDGKHVLKSVRGYAKGQLDKMQRGAFRGYMGEKRRKLVEKHGYDTKNAAHALRILQMGLKYARTDQLEVETDRKTILEVKRGEWELEEVKGTAEVLLSELDEAEAESTLPEGPDREWAETVLVESLLEAMETNHTYDLDKIVEYGRLSTNEVLTLWV